MKFRILVLLVCFLAVSAFGQEQVMDQQNLAFLTVVNGRVLLAEEQAQQDQYILKNDWLVTDKGGRAEIRFGENGGYLAVDENSKLFFVEVSPEKSVIALFQGTIYLRHLEGVELRAESKSAGKVIVPQGNQIIRIDVVNGKVEVYENPYLRDSFDSFNAKREKETDSEVAKSVEKQHTALICSDYYPYSYYWNYWRWYGLYFCWYPGWYPMCYYLSNYGYYYYNQSQYGYYGSNYGYSGRRVVSKNQLQSRQIIARPSRLNSSGNFNSSARASIGTYPSRISSSKTIRPMQQSSTSSFKPSSSFSRIQSRPTSSYRASVSSNSRRAAVSRGSSRGSSSSTSRSVSRSIRKK